MQHQTIKPALDTRQRQPDSIVNHFIGLPGAGGIAAINRMPQPEALRFPFLVCQGELHHWVEARVEAEDQRALGLVGQEDEVQLFEGVLDRFAHPGVPGELEDDVADAGAAR